MRQHERNSRRKLSAKTSQQGAREFRGATAAFVNSAICRGGGSERSGDNQTPLSALRQQENESQFPVEKMARILRFEPRRGANETSEEDMEFMSRFSFESEAVKCGKYVISDA
jgi:hypothetical protein